MLWSAPLMMAKCQCSCYLISASVSRRIRAHVVDKTLVCVDGPSKQHVIKLAGACYHQLRYLRQIPRHVGRDVTTRLVPELVTSRLDYCNSVLARLTACTVNILQRVQNAAARLIRQLKPHEHVTPSLQRLHWLPVKQRVQ